jgi:very-short-patch-repair endonuclease
MDDLRAICNKETVFLRREAIQAGYDDKALQRAVRAKVIHRVRHGAYAFVDEWTQLDERERHLTTCAAVLRTTTAPGVLSHVSAVAALDLPIWELPLDEVHLTRMTRKTGRSGAGVRQHHGRLTASEITSAHDLPVTSATRTAVDLTTVTDVEHALPVLCEMLRRGLTTRTRLQDEADGAKHVPGTLASELAIRLADARLESVAECRCWHLFFRQGMPMPQPQYEVFDQWHVLIGRVDFAWPELKVFVEFDGKEKYLKHRRDGESVVDAVLREKRREERICRLTGWRCIRITWADLHHPERTIALIASVLAGGPVHA